MTNRYQKETLRSLWDASLAKQTTRPIFIGAIPFAKGKSGVKSEEADETTPSQSRCPLGFAAYPRLLFLRFICEKSVAVEHFYCYSKLNSFLNVKHSLEFV